MFIGLFQNASTVSIPSSTVSVRTSGYDVTGRGAADYVYDATIGASHVAAHPRTAFVATNGRGFRLEPGSTTTPEMFGAKGDGTSNDADAIQAANDFLRDRNGGTLRFLGATYMLDRTIDHYAGIGWIGAGRGVTRVETRNRNSQVLRCDYQTEQPGTVTLEDMTFAGSARTYPSQDGDQLVFVKQCRSFVARNIELCHARVMSLAVFATYASITDSYIHHGLRDGINFTGSTVAYISGNVIDAIADDAIAIHTNNFQTVVNGPWLPSAIITGNRITRANGIKLLGGRNVTIADNHLERYGNYGVMIDTEGGTNEGYGTKFAIKIVDNNFLNGISAEMLGSTDIINSVILIGNRETADDAGVYEGNRNASGSILKPDRHIIQSGPALPTMLGQGITIRGNVIRQVLGNVVSRFSDYGFGKLWWVTGEIDPASSGLMQRIRGVRLDGDFDGVDIADNEIYGTANAIIANVSRRIRNVAVVGNRFTRVSNGMVISNTGSGGGWINITGNHFNIDPFFELADHNAADGSWSQDNGSSGFGVWTIDHSAAVIERNTFEHCRRPFKADNRTITAVNNTYIWDWSNYGGESSVALGIGSTLSDMGGFFTSRHVFRRSNPSQPNYNTYSIPADGALLTCSNTMPTSGYFVPGTFVRGGYDQVSFANGKRILGWRRITWGSSHVAGTDWVAVAETAA